jgi:putrescine importer
LASSVRAKPRLSNSDAPVTLNRRLGGFSAALFGLSYICPTVIISTFGILATGTGGAVASAYSIATVAILLTAISYARMAASYPEAGSAYAYVLRTVNPRAAFLVGWVLALDYFFVPMVICLFTAKAFEVVIPAVSYRVWVLVIACSTTFINVLGIKIANRVNLTIMVAQLGVIAALIALCYVFLGASNPASVGGALAPFVGMHTSFHMLIGGAAIAAYSFLGFDAVTTLSEETLAPTRNIPIATVFAAAASGAIYIVTSYLMTRVHPSINFRDVDNAGYEIVALVSGHGFILIFAIVMIAFVASVMCAQAGSSRLLFAMGRDGALPNIFARLNVRLRTPDFNIALTGGVMLIGLLVDVDTAASCVNFGAFTAFASVNLCVLYDHLGDRRVLPGGTLKLLLAGSGASAAAWLLWSLQRTAIVVGLLWLSVGCAYLWVRMRGRSGKLYLTKSEPISGDRSH